MSPGQAPALIEFHQIGDAVRVAAVDPASGLEVIVLGPASAARADLERLALAKLARALNRADAPAHKTGPSAPSTPARPGRVV